MKVFLVSCDCKELYKKFELNSKMSMLEATQNIL
jgi:hypothetical protein